MPAKSNDHPNLLGAAIFALVLGVIMLGLSLHARAIGQNVETDGVLMGAVLLGLSALAYAKHKELQRMTPEQRDRYWAAREAVWRDTADAHARARLGEDYDRDRSKK